MHIQLLCKRSRHCTNLEVYISDIIKINFFLPISFKCYRGD